MYWLKKLFGSKNCYVCGQKASQPQKYLDDKGKIVYVCYKCVPYAERRALRKP
ncbi:hypothetical protein GCM10011351_29920 [Paraliobacillus quinghaiensis]|uniref:Uncharacterized protein n=1 Tax=Paraliobacillus quinghaiensis TaxID=470815 RepID=A0A917WZ37_9BACI|nr:hypothetical protein [Paraliobacillus quinghaiensis]GGM41827.1 hypothetical protein GCM10011351_29920 [Paraliobacillus quinghaiensis]